MAQKQKELQGILFKNDKGDNQARPDYRGAATIDGREYRLSGWVKKGQQQTFLSVSFTPEEPAAAQGELGGGAGEELEF